jgi:protocatechuate 3,4-dioxygenase beta subunit
MRWYPLALLLGAALTVLQSGAAQNAPAQNAPSTAPTPDSERKKIRVEGTILSLNGDVVRKATVRLQGNLTQPGQQPTSYSESTDNAGLFVFEDVAPGRYTLSAEKAGFVTTRYGARSTASPGTQLNLTAGMEMKGLAVKMTPQGVVAGKVLDQDGDPVASVQVQVMRYTYQRGRRQLGSTSAGTTNDLGEYRIGNLAPGRYYVSASDRRGVQFITDRPGRAVGGQEGNITTFYPNGADASNAGPVDIVAGGEMRGIDIRFLRAKVYTVRGKASDGSGAPVQALVAFARKEDSGNLATALNGGGLNQLRPDGTFEFRSVVPGTYVLQLLQVINSPGGTPANVTGRVEVTVADANIEGLVLPLVAGPEITGTVKLEGGDISALLKPAQPTGGANSAGNPAVNLPVRFTLTLNETEGISINTPNAQVKDDGTFRFTGVGTSKYILNAPLLPQGTYLKSARFGGQDVTHAPIDTTSGTGGTLEITLSSKAASVTGSVQNDKGEALTAVMVTLWPKTPDVSPTGGARQAFTDQNGGFQFQGLAPNEYYVAAWEELEPGLAQSADFLGHFTSEASEVKLAEGGQESRSLKPVPGDKILVEIAKLP